MPQQQRPVLYDYWRSSAAYRVRIALNLLGLDYQTIPINLLQREHLGPSYRDINPQGLVPSLRIGDHLLTQSLAIIEFLHDITPGSQLLPSDPETRAHTRQLAHIIAMDIHPICNLGVVTHITELADTSVRDADTIRPEWMRHYIIKGLTAFETLLTGSAVNRFCCGDQPTLADICLVPQIYNARRWGADLAALPAIRGIDGHCQALEAFAAAHPDRVKPEASS
uniref:maleylacetoacetate isomerase n=1 Tax=Pararhizobium sp. IMCC3301 TaxID=3067904 RepID=UPI002741537A|nr:maleylacetoacetate isomerase [Pararhizobium sp. IMCC3301]